MKRYLTDTSAKNAKHKPDGKAAKHNDGGGLYLWVSTTAKVWRYDYKRPHTGKRNTLVIGAYPDISLQEARQRHEKARAMLTNGEDPADVKREEQIKRSILAAHTFEEVAREWFSRMIQPKAASYSEKVLGRLENDLIPWLGNRPIAKIQPYEVLACIRRIEDRGAMDVAHRALRECGRIFRYAVHNLLAEKDPTVDLKGALPPV